MPRFLLIIILLVTYHHTIAQTEPQLYHFVFSPTAINPAYTGLNNEICATAISRQQWMGFEGAPATSWFIVNSPLNLMAIPFGVGLSINNDQSGLANNLNVKLNLAYHRKIGKGILSIGLSPGFYNQKYSGTWKTPDGGSTDPAIPPVNENKMAFDLDLGVLYHINQLYLGVSVAHINQPNFNYSTTDQPYLPRHLNFTGKYEIELTQYNIDLIPALFIESEGTVLHMGTQINVLYNKRFWGGISYTIGDVGLNAGLNLYEGLKVGVAYDYTTSRINRSSAEVFLQFCFDLERDKKPQKYRSVRFL